MCTFSVHLCIGTYKFQIVLTLKLFGFLTLNNFYFIGRLDFLFLHGFYVTDSENAEQKSRKIHIQHPQR